MDYPMMRLDLAVIPNSNASLTAANLAATAAVWQEFVVMAPIALKRAMFQVTTAVTAGLVAPQVAIKSRPTYGSSSGAVTLVSLIIPNGTAAAKVLYKDISDNVRVQPGYGLSMEVSVQATDSGTAAGAGFIGCIYELAPDYDSNLSKMVASA